MKSTSPTIWTRVFDMHSVASISSASGAAGYLAGDNYYTGSESAEMNTWAGAKALGLEGKVDEKVFEAILDGVALYLRHPG